MFDTEPEDTEKSENYLDPSLIVELNDEGKAPWEIEDLSLDLDEMPESEDLTLTEDESLDEVSSDDDEDEDLDINLDFLSEEKQEAEEESDDEAASAEATAPLCSVPKRHT